MSAATQSTPPSAAPLPAAPADAPAPAAKSKRPRIILALVLLCAIGGGARMWWQANYFEETDNAYLAAHVSAVAPRLAGTVAKVLVRDNQSVRAGDVLLQLDPADHGMRVEQIKAQMAQLDAQVAQSDALIVQAGAEAAASEAQQLRTEVQLRRTSADAERYRSLFGSDVKAVSRLELDTAMAARDSASAEVRAQKEGARAARARTGAVQAGRATLVAQRNVLAAQLRDAELQLSYNTVRAPVSGRIGKKNVEVGSRVQAGQQLLAIVQGSAWVTANLKETQLAGLYQGQKVTIRIDAFPGQTFSGYVDSFSPGSGALFSLLPPENATGNFTKIVQRVPVKILFDERDLAAIGERMAPGMSANVEIDLRQGKPDAQRVALAR